MPVLLHVSDIQLALQFLHLQNGVVVNGGELGGELGEMDVYHDKCSGLFVYLSFGHTDKQIDQ